jgi:hypothetical protein
VQFWVQDVTFRMNRLVVPNMAPLNELLQANSVTHYLDNQKNGQQGARIHHMACPSWFCPVKSLAWHIASIIYHGVLQTTPLSLVSPGVHVVATNVTAPLIHQAALDTNLVAQGYGLRCLGNHSLRASGAMALKLNGINDSLIMKFGCWTGYVPYNLHPLSDWRSPHRSGTQRISAGAISNSPPPSQVGLTAVHEP